MDFLRNSILGRGQRPQGSQTPDLEQQADTVEQRPHHESRLFEETRSNLLNLFTGRPTRGRESSDEVIDDVENEIKASRFNLGLRGSPASRFRMPSLSTMRTRDSANPLSPVDAQEEQPWPRSRPQSQRFPVIAQPPAARMSAEGTERSSGRTRFNGTDPAEMHLAELAETGRRRQHRHTHRHDREHQRRKRRRHRQKAPPSRFLFCFPWVKSRQVRTHILRCFVSGLVLITMLTIYLSLSLTRNINTNEFSILLILLILLTTIFLCHGLVRLCMLLVRPKHRRNEVDGMGERFATTEYAVPQQPIRVVLARDEEAAGIESEATKFEPPAYGLWRESVRVDPNRIFWQRTEVSPLSSPDASDTDEDGRPRTAPRRPPSYVSEDGVDYVVDARPRSIAPPPSSIYSQTDGLRTPEIAYTSNEPLPPHPAERESSRRMGWGRPGNWDMI
ncbi:hypothetical protein GGR57DRAFT_289418 [Xylariaceae sp. FL1272]|nr:hypothetical protein GGR57DRAFT_289418 [Xylariaceae sp. FL1272]